MLMIPPLNYITNTLFLKRRKSVSLIEIPGSIYRICYLLILLIMRLSCLGSEFQHYSIDFEFPYQSLLKQWT